jgi:UDP-N-acetyl-D-glucosamine dehydrogenase
MRDGLLRKITDKTARVGVIGLGYVGLPLAVEFAKAGFSVTGIDRDPERVEQLNHGTSYIPDVESDEIARRIKENKFRATVDFGVIAEFDTMNICVPTPLRKTKDPDLSYILAAVEMIKKNLRRGQLVILESTTYPGTTQEILLPMLSETGLKVGEDFFLAFSPERVDPGNRSFTTKNIPKVVGGMTPACRELAGALYRQCIEKIVLVSSTQVAELVKLLENTFRSVNIALVNEMALMCHHLDIDVWEVIEAAQTKPFGFMPFYPGPGIGGHCIPVDPGYLSWKAKLNGFDPRLIDLAGQINSRMPHFVANKIGEILNESGKSVKGSRIHLLGVAYKRDIGDTRESPAYDLAKLLLQRGALLTYSDPYVPEFSVNGSCLKETGAHPAVLQSADCTVIVTDHSAFNYTEILEHAQVIFDTRNALRGRQSSKIVRL